MSVPDGENKSSCSSIFEWAECSHKPSNRSYNCPNCPGSTTPGRLHSNDAPPDSDPGPDIIACGLLQVCNEGRRALWGQGDASLRFRLFTKASRSHGQNENSQRIVFTNWKSKPQIFHRASRKKKKKKKRAFACKRKKLAPLSVTRRIHLSPFVSTASLPQHIIDNYPSTRISTFPRLPLFIQQCPKSSGTKDTTTSDSALSWPPCLERFWRLKRFATTMPTLVWEVRLYKPVGWSLDILFPSKKALDELNHALFLYRRFWGQLLASFGKGHQRSHYWDQLHRYATLLFCNRDEWTRNQEWMKISWDTIKESNQATWRRLV